MIAKTKKLIINGLRKSSLQSSLQKQLLSKYLNGTLCLHFSLHTQALLQMLCKENKHDWQPFIKIPLAHPFAENTNLRKA